MKPEPASSRFALWGGWAVVAVTDGSVLDGALNAVHRVVDQVDQACSSFRDDSELSALNRAGGETVAVSPVLAEHLEAALRAAEITDGDVDPTVGQALVALGFLDSAGGAPAPRYRLEAVPGYRTIVVDRAAGTVRLGRGVRVDLGATAKALAADQAVAAAAEVTGAGVLVSLSGDLAVAGPAPAGGWRIRVTDDHRSDAGAPGQWISLSSGGLATSSTTVRAREHDGERLHHVVDPATGAPVAVHFRTVSVAAASCLDANIATTAAIVRGERAIGWLESQGLPSRLVGLDGDITHLAGWPEAGEDAGQPASPVAA